MTCLEQVHHHRLCSCPRCPASSERCFPIATGRNSPERDAERYNDPCGEISDGQWYRLLICGPIFVYVPEILHVGGRRDRGGQYIQPDGRRASAREYRMPSGDLQGAGEKQANQRPFWRFFVKGRDAPPQAEMRLSHTRNQAPVSEAYPEEDGVHEVHEAGSLHGTYAACGIGRQG